MAFGRDVAVTSRPGCRAAVRAIVDFRPPYGVRDLAKRASVPLGSLSRTLDLLDREGFVTRESAERLLLSTGKRRSGGGPRTMIRPFESCQVLPRTPRP